MTSHCDSNPAQYERNRRFGHLVHALGRAAGGAKLPSVGLCLNASKAVSSLVEGGNDISRSLVSRKAQNNVTLLGGRPLHGPVVARARFAVRRHRPSSGSHRYDGTASNGRSWVSQVRCRDSESSVDDLGTWRGVVLGRAVTTLRSVETQPSAWGFVLSVRRDPRQREERKKERRRRTGERLSTARESRRRSSYFAVLSFLSFYLPLLLRITKATRRWRTCAPPAKATRRAGLCFLASYDGESNTPLAYLCYAGESNTPRGDFGFSRATRIKATRRAGTLISRALRRRKQHAARECVLLRCDGEDTTALGQLCAVGWRSRTPRAHAVCGRKAR